MTKNRPIGDYLARDKPVISVEFFPPKDEAGGEQVLEAAREVRDGFGPDFASITYGAGGTTRERTFRYARELKERFGFEVMPHLTCVGSSNEEILEIVEAYRAEGFCNLMALRGDPPKGDSVFRPHPGGPRYAADLVRLVRSHFSGFSIGVAGYPEVHPEAESAESDLQHLKEKVDAGGSFITTQLFYENAQFLDFVKRCRAIGISVPIIPGLMPIRSAKQARRFCKCIPRELDRMLDAAGEDEDAVHEVGVEWMYRQMSGLLDHGVKAFHLYIMNRSGMANEVMQRLRTAGRL